MWKTILVRIPLGALAVAALLWLLLPWPILLRWGDLDSTSFMKHRLRTEGDAYRIRHEWVPLDRISPNLRRAVVAAEDGRFYRHRGIDWRAVGEELRYRGDDDFSLLDVDDLRAVRGAVAYYLDHRGEVRGRSTITQQLAKNLFYTPERSLARKAQEFFVARRLEWFLDKERILELYLNTAEWGPGIFGAEAAARHYYDRPASDLTAVQGAALAATLPHPLTANPGRNAGRLTRRRDLILSWIRESRAAPEREVPPPPRIPRPDEILVEPPEPDPLEPPAREELPAEPPSEPTDSADAPAEDTVDEGPPPGGAGPADADSVPPAGEERDPPAPRGT